MPTSERTSTPPAFRRGPVPRDLARVLRRRRRLRADVVQLLVASAALALGLAAPGIDGGLRVPSARAVELLVAVGAATMTFIGVVYSLLFLVVQFGSTTFTPRLNLFRDDPIVWRSFALYVGLIVYSFSATVRLAGSSETSVWVPSIALLGALVSLALFRRLQMHAFTSIQLAATLKQVDDRGREVIDGLFPDRAQERPEPEPAPAPMGPARELCWPKRDGVLQVVDVPRVLRAAAAGGCEVRFLVGPGDVVREGEAIATVGSHAGPDVDAAVLRALTVGHERTFEQDPTFALRVLADIALRASSPAINDPTTAIQAIDTMDGLLRMLARRNLRDRQLLRLPDADGGVLLPLPDFDAHLGIAIDELLLLPQAIPSVTRRVQRMLEDLEGLADGPSRAAICARLDAM